MIEDYFTDIVTIISRTVDEWNNATDSEVDYLCRIDYTDRIVRSADGDDRQGTYRIYMKPGATVDLSDRVKIKSLRGSLTGDTQTFTIISLTKHAEFDSHHLRLIV